MERKIGEIFEYNGSWFQCCKQEFGCMKCYFNGHGVEGCGSDEVGSCTSSHRSDGKDVIFKKLEKVGEPYSDYCPTGRIIYFQRYRCYQKTIIEGNIIWHWADDTLIDIEIKQKQEDMNKEELRTIHGKTVKKIKGNCFDCCFYSKGMCELTMNRETIERAARDYVKPTAGIIPVAESIAKKEGFIAGAVWRINSVWHDCQKELPERENEWILLEAVINDKTIYLPVEWVNDGKGATKHMKRWAYVSDLLPDRKEVQP